MCCSARRGIALVWVLGVLSFFAFILALHSVRTQQLFVHAQQQRAVLVAKLNARFALAQAKQSLEAQLGHGAASTAPSSANPLITHVHNNANPTQTPTPLIAQAPLTEHETGTQAHTFTLNGNLNANGSATVAAPWLSAKNNMGNFTWWAQSAGAQLSIPAALHSQAEASALPTGYTPAQHATARRLVGRYPTPETLTETLAETTPPWVTHTPVRFNYTSSETGQLLADLSQIHAQAARYNNYPTFAAGVAENFPGAGVAENLNEGMFAFIKHAASAADVLDATTSAVTPSANSAEGMPLHPVLTELVVGMNFAALNEGLPTRKVGLYYYIFAELWNPYTRTLNLASNSNHPNFTGGDVRVEVRGMPSVQVGNLSRGHSASFPVGTLSQHMNVRGTLPPGFVSFTSRQSLASGPGSDAFTQGEATYRPREGTVVKTIGNLPLTPRISDRFAIKVPAGAAQTDTFNLEINFYNTAGSAAENDAGSGSAQAPFQTLHLTNLPTFVIDYQPLRSSDTGKVAASRFVKSPSSLARTTIAEDNGRYSFGIHLKLKDGPDNLPSLLQTWQPYSSVHVLNAAGSDDEGSNNVYHFVDDLAQYNRGGNDPSSPVLSSADFFRSTVPFEQPGLRQARLFDMPTQPLLNPAHMLSLHAASTTLTQTSAHHLLGSTFFSGISGATNQTPNSNTVLPNPRTQRIPLNYTQFASAAQQTSALASLQSASALWHVGGLNIHTPYPQAWVALLSAQQVQAATFTNNAGSVQFTRNLKNVLLNHPYALGYGLAETNIPEAEAAASQSTTNVAYAPPGSTSAWAEALHQPGAHPAMNQGFRELTSAEIAVLSEALVQEIAQHLSSTGRAFTSLTQLLESGALTRAIAQVPSLNQPGGTAAAAIPERAPAFICANTILNTLGAQLFTRTDTFTVHVAGTSANPGSETIQAQAVVQRMPAVATADILNPEHGEHPANKKARFRVLSVQYL